MNADRLAELRRISVVYVKLGDDEPVAFGSDVLQLLDEREALLEALKDAVYDSDFPAKCWLDAITKAEAE